jgi:hypothetical protein
MTTFNIDSWITDIKGAFISTLEESNAPMSYIEIAKKTGLKKHDANNWFAMGIIGELFETGEVEKGMKDGKTKYKIPGREYTLMPEVLEDLSCDKLKERLRALGEKVGGNKPALIKRLRDREAVTKKFLED